MQVIATLRRDCHIHEDWRRGEYRSGVLHGVLFLYDVSTQEYVARDIPAGRMDTLQAEPYVKVSVRTQGVLARPRIPVELSAPPKKPAVMDAPVAPPPPVAHPPRRGRPAHR